MQFRCPVGGKVGRAALSSAQHCRKETPPLHRGGPLSRAFRPAVMSQTSSFPNPAFLPKSKLVTQFPSSIPAIHPGTPPTQTLHMHTHTRKTLEGGEKRESGWISAAAQTSRYTILYLDAYQITMLRIIYACWDKLHQAAMFPHS